MKRQDEKTRRQILHSGLLVVAGGIVAATANAQEKIDPKMVQYQQMPKDGAKCSLCVNWVPPDACKIVSGKINPDGWCIAYAPKNA